MRQSLIREAKEQGFRAHRKNIPLENNPLTGRAGLEWLKGWFSASTKKTYLSPTRKATRQRMLGF